MSLGWYIYLLSLSGIAAKLLAWALCAWNDRSRDFRCARVWLGILAAEDVFLFGALNYLGLRSFWYARVYYGVDLFSIFWGLLVILRLSEIAFQEARTLLPFLRRGALLALVGIILMSSTGIISHWHLSDSTRSRFLSFAEELEQNMNVAGMLAAMILWGSINALAIPGVRLRRITAAIAVSFSTGALSWAFYALFGHYQIVAIVLSLVSTASVLLIGWTLAFEKETIPAADRIEQRTQFQPAAQS